MKVTISSSTSSDDSKPIGRPSSNSLTSDSERLKKDRKIWKHQKSPELDDLMNDMPSHHSEDIPVGDGVTKRFSIVSAAGTRSYGHYRSSKVGSLDGPDRGSMVSSVESGKSGKGALLAPFPKSNKMTLIAFCLMGGVLHLNWYNTVLQIAPFLELAIPGYTPTPIWLPMGSAGSLVGNIIFFMKPNPVRLAYQLYCALIVLVTAIIMFLFIIMTYFGIIGQTTCTVIVSIVFFVCETFRGYLHSADYGLTVFYQAQGINQLMSVALSAGEGVGGLIPWLLLVICSAVGLEGEKGNLIAVGIAWLFACLTSLLYIWALHYTFKSSRSKLTLDIFNKAVNTKKNDGDDYTEDGDKVGCMSTWTQAVKGTRLVGCGLLLAMAGTLNVYPQAFPFGYDISVSQTQVLLGIFTILDPVFRLSGFAIDKILGDKHVTKKQYFFFIVFKTIIFWPFVMTPYYWPDNSWLNQYWQYIIMMIALGCTQGLCIIMGVRTYMHNLPETQYKELSGSLVVVYLIIGVMLGQIGYLIYPAFLPDEV